MKSKKTFIYSAILVGLTIATKLLAIPDLLIYSSAIFFTDKKSLDLKIRLKKIVIFIFYALIPIIPWSIFALIHTGNPVYPLFTAYPIKGYWQSILNPVSIFRYLWETFANSPDPINPIFLAIIPFVVIYFKKLWQECKILLSFTIAGLIAWYITPQTGGGRYILPYLTSLTILTVFLISHLSKNWKTVFAIFIFLVAIISIFYRGLAIKKFVPVILGKETKEHFLTTHLQYNLGDFYDTDNYFKNNIKPTDKVLLYGFHNLYYVDFPFMLSDWAKKGDTFNYIAVQGMGLPERFRYWNLIYFNSTTQVRLYSFFGKQWHF